MTYIVTSSSVVDLFKNIEFYLNINISIRAGEKERDY